jgi:hypothetical protein
MQRSKCGVEIAARTDPDILVVENANLIQELAEARQQQVATGEILAIISRSPTDLQPVLDAVAASAARICEAFDAAIYRLDGNRLRLVAHHGPIPLDSGVHCPTGPRHDQRPSHSWPTHRLCRRPAGRDGGVPGGQPICAQVRRPHITERALDDRRCRGRHNPPPPNRSSAFH